MQETQCEPLQHGDVVVKRGDKLDDIWDRPPHTAAKHELLGMYLDAWFAIFGQSNRGRAVYLDGFAGPGSYKGGEDGSPILAVKRLLGHSAFDRLTDTEFVFAFNEGDTARHAELCEAIERLKEPYGDEWPKSVQIADPQNLEFGQFANEIIASLKGKRLAPTLFFIDPFGYSDVSMKQVAELLKYPACDLLIYFDFNSANRFATAGNVDHLFEEYFGSGAYKNAPPAGDPRRAEYLHDCYEAGLRSICNMSHIQSFAMETDGGRVGYYLFFCTNDLQAFDRMKAAMWKIDPSGAFRFSDRFAGQDVLFGPEQSTGPLRDAMLHKFTGETVRVPDISRWVVEETPFHSGQLKRATLQPMERRGEIVVQRPHARAQFNDQVTVMFA
jgi:three-Cys-motif partner protein